jgi:hypothetical protein
MMANTMLGFPNRCDTSTLSNGSWVATLPLTNLQQRVIALVARTTDATLASTKLDINLGISKNIRLVNLTNHNLSLAATYRVTASATATFAVLAYDSGWQSVWPVVYPYGTLEWEDDNFWTGQYTVEQIAGYTTSLTHILPNATVVQYWRIELNDTTNMAGYVQAGRLFIGPAWQPTNNRSYDSSLAWETKTVVDEAISGAEYFDVRTPYRVAKMSFDWMSTDEAFANAFELTRRAGMDQEIMFVYDPSDTVHALRRRFLSRMRTLNPIEHPYLNINKEAFEFKELL